MPAWCSQGKRFAHRRSACRSQAAFPIDSSIPINPAAVAMCRRTPCRCNPDRAMPDRSAGGPANTSAGPSQPGWDRAGATVSQPSCTAGMKTPRSVSSKAARTFACRVRGLRLTASTWSAPRGPQALHDGRDFVALGPRTTPGPRSGPPAQGADQEEGRDGAHAPRAGQRGQGVGEGAQGPGSAGSWQATMYSMRAAVGPVRSNVTP